MSQVTDETRREAEGIVAGLRAMRSDEHVAGQRRFGIQSHVEQLGITMPGMRAIAKTYRRRHDLAEALWATPVLEARMVAALVDDPKLVTREQMQRWANDFDNWALVDNCCCNLFDRTPGDMAIVQAMKWSRHKAEFIKRAGFVLMAGLAVHRKELDDAVFCMFLSTIKRECDDERNFVKKAANWALRQIGKRNATLHDLAMFEAQRIVELDTPAARWIGRDAIRELGKKKSAR